MWQVKAVDVSLSGIPLGWVGSKGIFVGIMCAFLSVHIYTYVERKGWTIKNASRCSTYS